MPLNALRPDRFLRLRLFIIFCLVIPHTYGQSTIYVTLSGAGDLSGSSWTNALPGIQLQNKLTSVSVNTQLWISAGMYRPTTGTNRAISFAMRNGVTIYGGFVGNEITLNQRPIINLTTPSSTTLSGDIGMPGLASDNSYHVFSNSNIDTTAVLDGFVITQGKADSFSNYYGGGILNSGSGSGNYCSPTIRNCVFNENQAEAGGAVYNVGRDSGESSPVFINCVFMNNTATNGDGGAVTNSGGDNGNSSPRFYNCLFINNVSQYFNGGAISSNGSYSGNSSPQFINCSFSHNQAVFNGGAIYCNGSYSGKSSAIIMNCSFSKNNVSNSGGGAIYHFNTQGQFSLTLINCIVWGNTATRSNTPGVGWNNQMPVISYSNIQGNNADPTVIFTGQSNININPSFVDAVSDNLHLQSNSPCLNVGDPVSNSSTVGDIDLDGNKRIDGGRIDMGAYEFQNVANSAEIVSIQNGSWIDTSTWSASRLPNLTDIVRLKHIISIPADYVIKSRQIIYESTGKLILNSGTQLLIGQ